MTNEKFIRTLAYIIKILIDCIIITLGIFILLEFYKYGFDYSKTFFELSKVNNELLEDRIIMFYFFTVIIYGGASFLTRNNIRR